MALRRPARPALPRRARPAGADDRVEGGVRAPPVPPAEGPPGAVGHAAPRGRARRSVPLRARRHLRRGHRPDARPAHRLPPDDAPRARLRPSARRRGARRARLRHVDGRLRRLGRRPRRQAVADGGLLPRRPPPPGRADGRHRPGRRPLELRPRQPRAAAEAADARRGRAVVAGRGRDRRARYATTSTAGNAMGWSSSAPTARGASPPPARRRCTRCATSSTRRLPDFGAHEDAMLQADPWMAHSLLSAPLNLGLLDPVEVVRRAEQAYRDARGADRVGRGLRPPGHRLARLRLAPLLAAAALVPLPQPPAGDHRPAEVVRRARSTRRSTRPACPTCWATSRGTAGCTTSRG